MTKRIQPLLSIFFVFALFMSTVSPAAAAVGVTDSATASERELIAQMQDMDFTEAEINYILELERARVRNASSIMPLAFPSNPEVGDFHDETYRVSFNAVTCTASGVAGALIGGGVGAGVALAIAAGIATNWADNADAKGVEVTITYYYGPDNHGSVGWTPGPVEWELYY